MTVRLTLLGSLALLDGDGKEVRAVLAQPKRLALLAYLVAHNHGGFCTRDALVAMFWPEFDEHAARAALSRAVYYLRHALGAEVLVARGDHDLGIDAARLSSDLTDLREALRAEDTPAVLALYNGDLLDGFHVDDAEGFASWLDAERQRLRSEVARYIGAAAAKAQRIGDITEAIALGRHACRLSPYDEDAMVHLMVALEAQGHRSEALLAYEAFTRRLREDLDASPRLDLAELAERIRRSGAAPTRQREIAPVAPPVGERVDALTVLNGTTPAAPMQGERSWQARLRHGLPWLLAAIVLALPVWFIARRATAVSPETVRFTLTIPTGLEQQTEGNGAPIAVSPDGKTIVYVGRTGELMQVYVRQVDQPGGRALPGTEEGEAPFFSPDGRSIGYWTYRNGGQIRETPVDGGASTYLGSTWWMDGAAWLAGDSVVVGSGAVYNGMSLIASPGAPLRELLPARFGANPVALPGGKLYLFTNGNGRISLAAPADSVATSLGVIGSPVGVLGHWMIYRRDTTLMGIAVDIGRRRVTGPPVQLLGGTPVAHAAVSANGTLVYERYSASRRAMLVDLSGVVTPLSDQPLDLEYPAVSPHGKRIAFTLETPAGPRITIFDVASKAFSQLVSADGERPAWYDDGTRIGYTTTRAITIAADGSGAPDTLYRELPDGANGIREVTFSPNGRYAVMRDDSKHNMADVWLLPLGPHGAHGQATPLVRTPLREGMARVSPDGRRLAFASDISGTPQVYVRPFPGPGPLVQVSDTGGMEPVWAPDGTGIFYRWGGHFMFARLSAGSPPSVLSRKALFADVYIASASHQEYDVMPDGKHLVVLEPYAAGADEGQSVNVIVGWLPELRRAMTQAVSGTTTPQQP